MERGVKKMKKKEKSIFVIIFALIFLMPMTVAAEQYLCVEEMSVGFYYDKTAKQWENTNFKANSKYIISKSEGKSFAFRVTKFEEKDSVADCESSFDKLGFLLCEGLGVFFQFNKNNGRYIRTYLLGYIYVLPQLNVTDEKSDTPYMEIGKCSPF
jgi:hypothetical protein